MMGGIGFSEMLVILLVILILFGAKRLPEVARSLGQGIFEFKKAMNSNLAELKKAVEEETKISTESDTKRKLKKPVTRS